MKLFKNSILFLCLTGLTGIEVNAQVEGGGPEVSDEASTVIVDISGKKVTPELFKNSATRAMMRRGWEISSMETNRIVGTLNKKDGTYKAAVEYAPPMIKIAYIKGYGAPKPNWLFNIKKDLLFELNSVLLNQ